jgi:hypothetical protein
MTRRVEGSQFRAREMLRREVRRGGRARRSRARSRRNGRERAERVSANEIEDQHKTYPEGLRRDGKCREEESYGPSRSAADSSGTLSR